MIRVVVAAADSIVRAGLESIIRASPELTVVGSAANITALVTTIETFTPDVVLLELGVDTPEIADKLLDSAGEKVAIALLADEPWVMSALRSGIRAILPRSATAAEIVATVIAVATGLVVLHPEIIDFLLPNLPSVHAVATPVQALTPREIEVLVMLAEGLGNKNIARRLGISEHTVKFHVSSIFTKLDVSSRTEAVTIGARLGLIML